MTFSKIKCMMKCTQLWGRRGWPKCLIIYDFNKLIYIQYLIHKIAFNVAIIVHTLLFLIIISQSSRASILLLILAPLTNSLSCPVAISEDKI